MLASFFQKIKKDTSVKTIIFLFLLSLFSVSLFKDVVNKVIVYVLLPKEQVAVYLDAPAELTLRTDVLHTRLSAKVDHLLLEEKTSDGYRAVFQMTRLPEQHVYVPLTDEMESVEYAVNDGPRISHTFTEEEKGAGFYKLYPFADSYLNVILSMALYFALGLICFIILLLIHLRLQERKLFRAGFWEKEYSKPYRWFLIVWLAIYALGMCQYIFHIGTPHYLPDNALGDQVGYWNRYILKHFFFDFEQVFATFHGYFMFLIPSLAKGIGKALSVDPVKVYLLFPSMAFSWIITLGMPRLYSYAAGKKAKLVSVLLFGAIFVFYWDAYVIGVLTDVFAAAFFFAFLTYTIKVWREGSLLFAALWGISAACMINIRLNYLYAVEILAVALIIGKVIQKRKERKSLPGENVGHAQSAALWKKRIPCVLIAVLFFLLVSAPQVIYNYKRGHIGLFPYDSPEAYGGHPVIWSGWNTFLCYGMVLWPQFISDDQLATMKAQLYSDRFETLHPAQAMDVYANSPIETVICLFKKTFTILDTKSNINYGEVIYWRQTPGMLYSFFNYLILLTAFYVLIRYALSKKERIAIWLLFLGTFVPQLMAHCEWRNGLTFYLLLYALFSYHFVGEILAEKGKYRDFCRGHFYQFIAFGQLFCFGLSMTLWA